MKILSVIIPVYNNQSTILATLNSLKIINKQNRSQIEIICINDGSKDLSIDIICEFADKNKDFCLILKTQENKGSANARNKGLNIAQGEWIFFLDADDELNFDIFEIIKKYSQDNYTSFGFCIEFFKIAESQSCNKINKKKYFKLCPNFINKNNFLDVVTSKSPFQPSCILFKKRYIRVLFNEEFIFLEDWLFWASNPDIFENMLVLPKITAAKIIIYGQNKSSNQAKNGKYRKKVAQEILKNFDKKLTKKQKNNLLIQIEIGKILKRESFSFKILNKIPCDAKLYTKLIIYLIFYKISEKINIYELDFFAKTQNKINKLAKRILEKLF